MNAGHTERPEGAELGGSAPCLLHELGPDGRVAETPQALARFRKGERERLIGLRSALDASLRTSMAQSIAAALDALIAASPETIVSVYWPIRGEPDLRPWMRARCAGGTRIALPVAIQLGQPLVFREWRPDAPLARGLWKIPYPADGVQVTPTVVIAPLVGYDRCGYRLGYGGGFFDRTLAMLAPAPLVIGVGYRCLAIESIYPQPHDIPMDWIVTEAGAPIRATAVRAARR